MKMKTINTDYPGLFEMAKMVGIITPESILKNMHFTSRNLAFGYDKEVQKMSKEFVEIVQNMIELSTFYSGHVLNTGSECNETAIAIAREITNKNTIVYSNIAHSSIKNRAEKLSMNPLKLDVNPYTFQIDENEIQKIINENNDISTIVLTGPTTQIGNYETLSETTLNLIKEKNIRIHIDSIPGLISNVATPKSLEERFFNEQYIDSLAVAPQKFFGPFSCSILYFRNNEDSQITQNSNQYFNNNLLYNSTMLSAFPTVISLHVAKQLRKNKLKNIAKECIKKKEYVIEGLKDYLQPHYNSETNIVTFKLPFELTDSFCKEVEKKNYKVSPFKLEGKNKEKEYALGGFSICISPRETQTYERLDNFVKTVKELL